NIRAKVERTLRHRPSMSFVRQRLANQARVRDVGTATADALGVERGTLRAKLHNVEHHRAHVASAFFVSPFDEAAVLSVDGFGDFASTMLAVGRGRRLEILDRVLFPHSLGLFYTAVTQWLGFPKYGDEGKVMGLAPYGSPLHVDELHRLVRPTGGLFELELDYFTHHTRGVEMTWADGSPVIGRIYSQRLEELLGPARQPDEPVTTKHEDVAR